MKKKKELFSILMYKKKSIWRRGFDNYEKHKEKVVLCHVLLWMSFSAKINFFD